MWSIQYITRAKWSNQYTHHHFWLYSIIFIPVSKLLSTFFYTIIVSLEKYHVSLFSFTSPCICRCFVLHFKLLNLKRRENVLLFYVTKCEYTFMINNKWLHSWIFICLSFLVISSLLFWIVNWNFVNNKVLIMRFRKLKQYRFGIKVELWHLFEWEKL